MPYRAAVWRGDETLAERADLYSYTQALDWANAWLSASEDVPACRASITRLDLEQPAVQWTGRSWVRSSVATGDTRDWGGLLTPEDSRRWVDATDAALRQEVLLVRLAERRTTAEIERTRGPRSFPVGRGRWRLQGMGKSAARVRTAKGAGVPYRVVAEMLDGRMVESGDQFRSPEDARRHAEQLMELGELRMAAVWPVDPAAHESAQWWRRDLGGEWRLTAWRTVTRTNGGITITTDDASDPTRTPPRQGDWQGTGTRHRNLTQVDVNGLLRSSGGDLT